MRKRVALIAAGLAVAALSFGSQAAKADHCRSGFGGYGGFSRGGFGGYGGIRAVPSYRGVPSYGYRSSGYYRRGLIRPNYGFSRGRNFYGGRRYGGSSFFLSTPRFSFGIRR